MNDIVKLGTRRQKMEAKERAILQAARNELSQHGFEGAKMSAIACAEEVAEGTVYLYYRNKRELLDAVVSEFWQILTTGSRVVTGQHETTLDKLRALAEFHLKELVKDFDFVGFTVRTRETGTLDSPSLTPIRAYVAVFDEIFRQGQDRGTLVTASPLWVVRDLFYGTLEYASRTLHLHQERRHEEVVYHLIELIQRCYGADPSQAQVGALEAIEQRLQSIERQLTNQ